MRQRNSIGAMIQSRIIDELLPLAAGLDGTSAMEAADPTPPALRRLVARLSILLQRARSSHLLWPVVRGA